jgi:2-polyprenyl-3-methyl-5-hydroxy-6-metoxy-1,4-benzoquinol methylase
MANPIKALTHKAGRAYIEKVCSSEFEAQKFKAHNERPIEYSFALRALGERQPVTVLDVGTGTTAWPPLLRHCGYIVTAIDNVRDYWPAGMVNRHWTVKDVNILEPGSFGSQTHDAVTCISVLEHIEDHVRAMRNMTALLKPGGTLVLTTPYCHTGPYPNVYKHPEALYGQQAPYICRSSSSAEFDQWLALGLTLERRELWRLFTGPVWATGQRRPWEQAQSETDPHQLGCFVFRKS